MFTCLSTCAGSIDKIINPSKFLYGEVYQRLYGLGIGNVCCETNSLGLGECGKGFALFSYFGGIVAFDVCA